jgi:membrane protein insertase, YidC/Oxa1 family, C-terminal domain
MSGILLTQSTTPIIGQVAWLLGQIMNVTFNFLERVGIPNIGLCIILFTIIVYMFILPLTIKQQKFMKLSAVMNPEIQKIQKKYKGKKDQVSMQKQQEEMQMVYEKYGTSQMAGCSQMFIQMPILFGFFAVVRNIPAYVSSVQNHYIDLIDAVKGISGSQEILEEIGKASPILIDPEKFDYSKTETLIDVFYKFQNSSWETLVEKFPSIEELIVSTQQTMAGFNSFLGINIAETPSTMFTASLATRNFLSILLAVSIPILAGVSQYVSIKMTAPKKSPMEDSDNPMMNSMGSMNKIMPLFSVVMGFTMPAGLGLYWIISAVVRSVQQILINKYLDRIPVEEMIAKNQEKAAKKREKSGATAKKINEMAQKNVRNIKEPTDNVISDEEKEKKIKEVAENNKNAKAGSLAARASLVKKYNENE